VVEVSPPASHIKQSKAVAQVKMGPPKGATKPKARPRKKRVPSVEEVVSKKKKKEPLFPPRFQLLKDPNALAYPLMADELDSLLPILQTSLVSALFQASGLFLFLFTGSFQIPTMCQNCIGRRQSVCTPQGAGVKCEECERGRQGHCTFFLTPEECNLMSTNLFVTQAANSLSTSLIFRLAVVFSRLSYRFPLSL